jgi:hypothetical protein
MRNPFAQLAYETPEWLSFTVAIIVGVLPFAMSWVDLIVPSLPVAIAIAIFGAYGSELRAKQQ